MQIKENNISLGKKNKRETGEFCYWMTITIRPLVA